MDVVAGLASLGHALGIVKELRQIDKGLDLAEFKLKLAEIYGQLADVKMALNDAKETIQQKDSEIASLNAKISALSSGDNCPICRSGHLKTISVHDHPIFGDLGVQEKTLKCDNTLCNHTQKQMHDPLGRTSSRR